PALRGRRHRAAHRRCRARTPVRSAGSQAGETLDAGQGRLHRLRGRGPQRIAQQTNPRRRGNRPPRHPEPRGRSGVLAMIVRRHHLLLIASLPLATCLPEDARPEPGVAIASASADPGLASGFITADGWSVTFTTFLLTVGELDLGGDDCTPYAESDYLRLLDLRQPGPQRLALLHGLGDCDIAF